MDAYKKAGNRKDEPPSHDMVHFAGLLSSKREFGDFRTVLHTGLYSQIVAMEVPVGGDIGDEVSLLWLSRFSTTMQLADNLVGAYC
jgi:putative ABC transport system ATP-binding protein